MTIDLTPFTPTGPANAVTDETTGERWYVLPEPYGRLLSVTTAFRSIAKSGLVMWSGMLAAAAAFVELPTVLTASRIKPCEKSYSRCGSEHGWQATCERCPCSVCQGCVERWLSERHIAESSRRADEGKRTHDVIEWWSLHSEIRDHTKDIAPYVAAFKAFVEEHGIQPADFLMCEATVLHPSDRFAGTTDGIIRISADRTQAAAKLVARVLRAQGEYSHIKTGKALVKAVIRDKRYVDLIIDWKTREGEGPKFYPEYAMQVTGYRKAPIVQIKRTETYEPMPETDGAIIVQLRPDGFTPRLAVADDVTYRAFLSALDIYLWLSEFGSRSIGAYTFPLDLKPAKVLPRSEDDGPPLGEPPADPDFWCGNCNATFEQCDESGCGQRRERFWRSNAEADPFDRHVTAEPAYPF